MKQETRVDSTGEVFTPRSLIRNMLDRWPEHIWLDPNKTWLEPSAGDGNFLEELLHRLEDQGIPVRHILDNQLFSVELIDENHYALQVRLGYLQLIGDALVPGDLWSEEEWDTYFKVSILNELTLELNDENNPYAGKVVIVNGEEYVLQPHEVYHHRNHLCGSFLDPKTIFDDVQLQEIPLLTGEVKPWREDTRDIGEKITYISTLFPRSEAVKVPKQKLEKVKVEKAPKVSKEKVTKETKTPKEPRGEGKGGWAVHPKNYGTGKMLRSFFNGEWYTAKHDDLFDDVNASLKEKGLKTLEENPRGFGASSGLRGKEKYWSKE